MPTLAKLYVRVQNNLPIVKRRNFKRRLQRKNVILFPNVQHAGKENADFRYKSQACQNQFDGVGACTRLRCTFAHTSKELKDGLNRRKQHTGNPTVNCEMFKREGWCRYGNICRFNHDQPITKTSNTKDRMYKTSRCTNKKDKHGNCVYVNCKYAHSELEVRPLYTKKIQFQVTPTARNIDYQRINELWYMDPI
jgi:hypothetical protein